MSERRICAGVTHVVVPEVGLERHATTREWIPSCDHDDPSGRCSVLDLFNGSARTGVVAIGHSRDYIGIDRNLDYIEMSRRHLAQVSPLFSKEAV